MEEEGILKKKPSYPSTSLQLSGSASNKIDLTIRNTTSRQKKKILQSEAKNKKTIYMYVISGKYHQKTVKEWREVFQNP